MRAQIKLLIASVIIITAALFLIQFYFLRNTWHLYQQKTIAEVKEELSKIEKEIDIDLLRNQWLDSTQKIIATGSPEKITNYFKSSFNSVASAKMEQLISTNEKIKKNGVLYFINFTNIQIKYLTDSTKLIVIKNKAWFGTQKETQFELLKYTLAQAKASSTYNNVYCEVHTQSGYSIANLRTKAMHNMLGLILFSILLVTGVIVLFYISVLNILKQKKIAAIKTEFVNSIRHEFNTPLTTIDIAIAALKTNEESYNEMAKSSIGIIDRQNKRLKLLLKQVIDSSDYAVSAELHISQTVMNEFMETIIADKITSNPDKLFKYTPSADKIILSIDQFHITTAISNIIDNAIKYGGDTIEISTYTSAHFFVISIKDNGLGIEEKYRKSIFEKFRRISTGNVYNAKGLGLGLYYAMQIVKAHGGTIEVDSKVGYYTLFNIKLPLS